MTGDGPRCVADGEQTGAVRCDSDVQLAAEAEQICTALGAAEALWSDRVAALQRLRGLAAGGAADLPLWRAVVGERLRPHICAQICDLRSQVVREACETVGVMCRATPPSVWEDMAAWFVPSLQRQLPVTVQAIASSAHQALLQMVESNRFGAAALRALAEGARHKNARARCRTLQHIHALLQCHPFESLPQAEAGALCAAVVGALGDTDGQSRAAARQAFWTLEVACAPRAAELWRQLPAPQQRALERERGTHTQRPPPPSASWSAPAGSTTATATTGGRSPSPGSAPEAAEDAPQPHPQVPPQAATPPAASAGRSRTPPPAPGSRRTPARTALRRSATARSRTPAAPSARDAASELASAPHTARRPRSLQPPPAAVPLCEMTVEERIQAVAEAEAAAAAALALQPPAGPAPREAAEEPRPAAPPSETAAHRSPPPQGQVLRGGGPQRHAPPGPSPAPPLLAPRHRGRGGAAAPPPLSTPRQQQLQQQQQHPPPEPPPQQAPPPPPQLRGSELRAELEALYADAAHHSDWEVRADCFQRLSHLAGAPEFEAHAAKALDLCQARLCDPHFKVVSEVLACIALTVERHPREALLLLERILSAAFSCMSDRKPEVKERARKVVEAVTATNTVGTLFQTLLRVLDSPSYRVRLPALECYLYLLQFAGEYLAAPRNTKLGIAKLLRVISTSKGDTQDAKDAVAASVACLHGMHQAQPEVFVAEAAVLIPPRRRTLLEALRELLPALAEAVAAHGPAVAAPAQPPPPPPQQRTPPPQPAAVPLPAPLPPPPQYPRRVPAQRGGSHHPAAAPGPAALPTLAAGPAAAATTPRSAASARLAPRPAPAPAAALGAAAATTPQRRGNPAEGAAPAAPPQQQQPGAAAAIAAQLQQQQPRESTAAVEEGALETKHRALRQLAQWNTRQAQWAANFSSFLPRVLSCIKEPNALTRELALKVLLVVTREMPGPCATMAQPIFSAALRVAAGDPHRELAMAADSVLGAMAASLPPEVVLPLALGAARAGVLTEAEIAAARALIHTAMDHEASDMRKAATWALVSIWGTSPATARPLTSGLPMPKLRLLSFYLTQKRVGVDLFSELGIVEQP